MNAILEEALKLPISERLKLIGDIWDSIDARREAIGLTHEQEAELERRLKDYQENPVGNYSWEEIEAEALAR